MLGVPVTTRAVCLITIQAFLLGLVSGTIRVITRDRLFGRAWSQLPLLVALKVLRRRMSVTSLPSAPSLTGSVETTRVLARTGVGLCLVAGYAHLTLSAGAVESVGPIFCLAALPLGVPPCLVSVAGAPGASSKPSPPLGIRLQLVEL